MKLNNIRLLVNDFDKSFSFYKDILGLKCSWGKLGDNFASFDIGIPSGLAIFKSELMNQVIKNSEVKKNEIIQDRFSIVIEVDNVDEIYKVLQNKNVNFITLPKDMPNWGIRVSHLRDPENNLIEIFSHLSKDKWDKHLIEDEKKYKD